MKPQLIQQLENEHQAIIKYLDDLKTPYSQIKTKQDSFLAMKNLLLKHLDKENTELYPILLKNEKTSIIARSFSSGMTTLAEEIMKFINEYENDFSPKTTESQHTGFEYAKQLGRITGLLKNRISNEEKVLYAEYANISI